MKNTGGIVGYGTPDTIWSTTPPVATTRAATVSLPADDTCNCLFTISLLPQRRTRPCPGGARVNEQDRQLSFRMTAGSHGPMAALSQIYGSIGRAGAPHPAERDGAR